MRCQTKIARLSIFFVFLLLLTSCGKEGNKKIIEKVEEFKEAQEEKRISNIRPTSFKKHIEIVCDEIWRVVEANDSIRVMELGVIPKDLNTSALKKRISKNGLSQCVSDKILKSAEAENNANNVFLQLKEAGALDELYAGLSKGSIEELSEKNKNTFVLVTNYLEILAGGCLSEASKKGN